MDIEWRVYIASSVVSERGVMVRDVFMASIMAIVKGVYMAMICGHCEESLISKHLGSEVVMERITVTEEGI